MIISERAALTSVAAGVAAGVAIGFLMGRRRPTARLALQLAHEKLRLDGLPVEVLVGILMQLSVREIASTMAVSREFRDHLVEQTLMMVAPILSGLSQPREPLLPASSDFLIRQAPDRAWVPQPRTATTAALSVRRLALWAADLMADEALFHGRLMPGEYHCACATALWPSHTPAPWPPPLAPWRSAAKTCV
jgi:hypothetical protein